MKKFAIVYVLLVLLFPSKGFAPIAGKIQGIVRDVLTKAPIGNALIKTDKHLTAITSPDGFYILENHLSGAYTLRVEADGYQTSIVSGTLAESDIVIQDIFLCPLTLPKCDLNGDNSVDLKDAIIALKIFTGLAGAYCNQADVNGDNKIGVEELTYILQKVAGLR